MSPYPVERARRDLLSWGRGASAALVTATGTLSYAGLRDRVERTAAAWTGAGRRLVLVELVPTVEAVVTHLAALAAGHVVLLAAPGRVADIVRTWDPDDHARPDRDGRWHVRTRHAEPVHELHPDLALLTSTSGSTGSPKLVRLSFDAVATNARDIAEALGLTAADRGATTLPLHYCYGLSVLHAHLAAGASVLLTDGSVVEPDLWADLARHGVTNLAAVPHTFELLEASAAPTSAVPSLRLVTQAGGRLAPEAVAAWSRRGSAEGWELRVMYGQTEATARMAVTAPGQTARDPHTVGHALTSGRFTVREGGRELPPGAVGELHFTGPNVMLGYAERPSDLARGRDVHDLPTGDLATLADDGSVRIVGRRAAFLKIQGVRIDVERVEEVLAADGIATVVTGSDDALRALVARDGRPDGDLVAATSAALVAATGLAPHRVGVAPCDALPRTGSGKPDRAAAATAYELHVLDAGETAGDGAGTTDLVALYARMLGRPDARAEDTFVSLGGDSLSYVELSLHLEERLGGVPQDWPHRSIATLAVASPAAPGRSRLARVETTIVLRALAILAIVGSHSKVFTILGGAHILLGVAGWNFARFAAASPDPRALWGRVGRTATRVAVPVAVWVTAVGALFGTYGLPNVVLLNWLLGPDHWTAAWRLWFVEALVWILLLVATLLSVPPLRKAYARAPFAFTTALVAVSALSRLDSFDLTSPPGRGTVPAVLWLFALGWAAQVARSNRQRLLLSVPVAVVLPGFMDDPVREGTIALGLLLLTWVRAVPVPRVLVPALSALASASLFIYLTHFEIYRATPWPLANYGLGLGLGLLAWLLASWLEPRVRAVAARLRGRQRPAPSRDAETPQDSLRRTPTLTPTP